METICRCCGKPLSVFEKAMGGGPIHTKCISKHWGKHFHGINASRCLEFSYKAKKTGRRTRTKAHR